VEGVRDAADSPSANGWRAQQADALVAIAKDYLSRGQGGAKPTPAADHYQVVIHADASALHGGISVDNSHLRGRIGRSDMALETVRRLACDGSLITIVEDEEGTPLDVGRKPRTVTTALKRALWSHDHHCSFSGCHNRCYVDAHHIEHWADGGATSLENLTLLHDGGFKIRRDGEGALYFQRPDGRVIPRFGYRLEDMWDDDGAIDENPSVEVHPSTKPFTEVREPAEIREPAAIYYLPASRHQSATANAYLSFRGPAGALSKQSGEQVRVFLIGDGAACAHAGQKLPAEHYNIEVMLKAVAKHGGEVGVCGSCMDARGMPDAELVEGTRRSALSELTTWTAEADRVLVF
jgi:uncharacterized protein involved in oxidation of intracellular sulfur